MSVKPIVEWWELWWKKPGALPVMVPSGWPSSGSCRSGTHPSKQSALNVKKRERNKYHVIVHVRRFKMKSYWFWKDVRSGMTYDHHIDTWFHALNAADTNSSRAMARASKPPRSPLGYPPKLFRVRRRVST